MPVILSPELQAIADDLEQKHTALRELVVQELGCGQGDAPPKDFINPAPVFDLLDEFQNGLEFHPAPSASEQSYWGPRFLAAKSLAKEAFGTIPKRIEKEREAIGNVSQAAAAFVRKAGIDEFDPRVGLDKCLLQLLEIITLQRGAQHKKPILPFPNDPFDQLWQRRLVQSSEARASWATAIASAAELSKDKDRATILAFDPARLKEVGEALKLIEHHLGLIDQHLTDEEGQGSVAGDSRPKLLAALQAIEELADNESATNP